MPKFLINNGKPAKKSIYLQRYENWKEKSGRRVILETVLPNRMGLMQNVNRVGNDITDEEVSKARQLGLLDNQKAWIYYDDDGRNIPEIYNNGTVLPKKVITDINDSFDVEDFPHVMNFVIGLPGQMAEKRKYTIKCGEIAIIENDRDADVLMRTFHFLDECNQKGEVVSPNKYGIPKGNAPVDYDRYFKLTNSMAIMSENQVPRESPNAQVKEIKKDTSIDES